MDGTKQVYGDILGDYDATARMEMPGSTGSAQTKAAALFTELTQPGQQQAQSQPGAYSFGSPQAPPSPLDGAAKTLNFDGGAAPPAPAPPTPSIPPSPPVPSSTAAQLPLPGTPATPAPTPGVNNNLSAGKTNLATVGTPLGPGTARAGGGINSLMNTNSAGENVDGAVDYDGFVRDTLLWTNSVRSAVYLVGGLLVLWALRSLMTGSVTLVTGVCWVLLAQAGLNFVRGFINPKLQARCTWQDSPLTSALLRLAQGTIQGAAALHDKHLVAPSTQPLKALRIVVALWLISLAGRVLGFTGLAATLWVLAFIVPKMYQLYQDKVDRAAGDVYGQVKAQFLRLDPRARGALVVLPTFIGGFFLSRGDLAVMLLALALYGRSFIGQAQVDRINAAVPPAISNTVAKVGDGVGNLVHSTVVKYELTPTPAKRKLL